jgi:4-hydroxy-tetrahydrodipicolinate reductase
MTRVAVLGAAGRMGRTVCNAVAEDGELELVAAVDPGASGSALQAVAGLASPGLTVAGEIDEIERAGADVAVDFTVAPSALANARWCADHGVHAVIGTSGLGPDELAELAGCFEGSKANCVVAPNFAIGAVLMMRFAALAAPYMDAAEIVELHHDAKIDAPSGTAMRTAELMDEARHAAGASPWPPDPTTQSTIDGTRGGAGAGGLRIHSVRLPGLMAHQEVIFGARGQGLTIRCDSFDRTSFMPGVVLAVKRVADRPGLTIGLEALLAL